MPTTAPVERVPATGVAVGDAVDDKVEVGGAVIDEGAAEDRAVLGDDEVEVGGAVVDEGAAEDGAVLGDDEVGKLARALIAKGVAAHTSCTVLPSLKRNFPHAVDPGFVLSRVIR